MNEFIKQGYTCYRVGVACGCGKKQAISVHSKINTKRANQRNGVLVICGNMVFLYTFVVSCVNRWNDKNTIFELLQGMEKLPCFFIVFAYLVSNGLEINANIQLIIYISRK